MNGGNSKTGTPLSTGQIEVDAVGLTAAVAILILRVPWNVRTGKTINCPHINETRPCTEASNIGLYSCVFKAKLNEMNMCFPKIARRDLQPCFRLREAALCKIVLRQHIGYLRRIELLVSH